MHLEKEKQIHHLTSKTESELGCARTDLKIECVCHGNPMMESFRGPILTVKHKGHRDHLHSSSGLQTSSVTPAKTNLTIIIPSNY